MRIELSDPVIQRGFVHLPRRAFRLSRSFETSAPRRRRVLDVYDAFGLGLGTKKFVVYDKLVVDIDPGDVVYITGESGGGKSLLLKDLAAKLASIKDFRPVIGLKDIKVPSNELLIEGVGSDTKRAIESLSAVGLGEAFVFLRRFGELSDGQKFRYLIAKALDRRPKTLVVDEFCSNLDRTTAKVLAFLVQRRARAQRLTLLVATSHEDLIEDLGPDVLVKKAFGHRADVTYDLQRPQRCSLMGRMTIAEGTWQDYKQLAEFHYRGGSPGFRRAVYSAKFGNELAGVIVYVAPHRELAARNAALPIVKEMRSRLKGSDFLKWLNDHFVRISRVVVHPKFRGIGLGVELVKRTMPLVGKPYVETLAVMARYNPFFERAGMRRVQFDRGLPAAVEDALVLLDGLGADDFVLRDERLFRRWYRSIEPSARRRVSKLLKSAVGGYWAARSSNEPSELARALVRLLARPQYLIWKNPDPRYESLPEPITCPLPSAPREQAS
ncbi:MAG: ATP-binding cassette domain-containing protein [Thaumarchaeota archaeon]|nr:ATP-binding cassette domain-containing protein [Candidatus Calditenuaceae archaeon]